MTMFNIEPLFSSSFHSNQDESEYDSFYSNFKFVGDWHDTIDNDFTGFLFKKFIFKKTDTEKGFVESYGLGAKHNWLPTTVFRDFEKNNFDNGGHYVAVPYSMCVRPISNLSDVIIKEDKNLAFHLIIDKVKNFYKYARFINLPCQLAYDLKNSTCCIDFFENDFKNILLKESKKVIDVKNFVVSRQQEQLSLEDFMLNIFLGNSNKEFSCAEISKKYIKPTYGNKVTTAQITAKLTKLWTDGKLLRSEFSLPVYHYILNPNFDNSSKATKYEEEPEYLHF